MIKPDSVQNQCVGPEVRLVPDSLPKGEGRSGTAAWTAICGPWNVRGMSLIGGVVALDRWLRREMCLIQLFLKNLY